MNPQGVLLTFCLVAFCTLQTVSSSNETLVQVQQGWLQGLTVNATYGNFSYYAFLSIPYAQPPVGNLRFKAPLPALAWNGTRNATEFGPMCPQYNPVTFTLIEGDEDCLTLQVYTNTINETAEKPVMVYFSGFADLFDEEMAVYNPEFLVSDLVVVTFQSRLDALGFLNLDTPDVPGNAGKKDEVLVLKWVRDNISKFGGSPDKVTLVGVSSGASGIVQHMMSPMSRDLFRAAAIFSGDPSCDPILPYKVKEKSYKLATMLGSNATNGADVLTFLQSLNATDLIYRSVKLLASEEVTNQVFKKMATFAAMVEKDFGQDRFIIEDITTTLGAIRTNKPVMMGYSTYESTIVVDQYADGVLDVYNNYLETYASNKMSYQLNSDEILRLAGEIKNFYIGNANASTTNMKEFVKCTSFAGMGYDLQKLLLRLSEETRTYLFKLSSNSSRNYFGEKGYPYGIYGPAHGDVALYMFNALSLNLTVDEDNYGMIKQFSQSVIDFVTYGAPDVSSNITWPLFNADDRYYVDFTDTMTVEQGPDSDQFEFWDNLYQSVNINLYP